MRKLTSKPPLNVQYFLQLMLVVILSIPAVVFSAIEFPENTFPNILQKISKNELNHQINVLGDHLSTSAIATYNTENKLKTYFYNDRVDFTKNINVHWAIRLKQYGFLGDLKNVDEAEPEITGQTITYQHDENLTQWYINSDLGIEHGIKLKSPPSSIKPTDVLQTLQFKFVVTGGVKFKQHDDDISLVDAAGNILFWYHNIIAFDENNQSLPVKTRMDGDILSFFVDASKATYPIYVDPLFTAEKQLSGASEGNQFGRSVATAGDTVVIGEPSAEINGVVGGVVNVNRKNSSGRNVWGAVKKLSASVPVDGANFGQSVTLSESIIIVGAPNENNDQGAVYVFYRDEGGVQNWGQIKKIVSDDIADGDLFGSSVSLSGDMLVVGAPSASGGGAVYIFDIYENGIDNWGQIKKITSPAAVTSDRFGESVSIDAETLIVGAPGESTNTGAAYVFYLDLNAVGGGWGQAARLVASTEIINAEFGLAVSVYENNIVVGAPFNLDDNNGAQLGSAYIFNRDEGGADSWGQITILTGDVTLSDNFGFSVAQHDEHVAIGANKDDNSGEMHGAVYIFIQDSVDASSWPLFKKYRSSDATEQNASSHSVFSGTGDASLYGMSVSVSGDTFVVGGAENVALGKGSAYIYTTAVDISLSGTQTSVENINDSVNYIFTISNEDEKYSSTGVVFSASFNKSFNVTNVNPSAGSCVVLGDIVCNLGTIGSNGTDVTVIIEGDVSSFGLYGIRATIEADQADSVIDNNTLGLEGILQDTRGITNRVDAVGCSLSSSSSSSFDLTLLLLVVFSLLAIAKREIKC